MKISINELRRITARLYDDLESQGLEEIELTDDYYWVIPADQLYNPNADPTDLGLDQLSDNWEWLSNVRTNETDPIPHHLVWLGAILRWIGERAMRAQ